jgi:hypothetical protein
MTDNNKQKQNTDNDLEKVLFNVQCLFAVRFAVTGNLSDNKVYINEFRKCSVLVRRIS